MLKTFMYSRVDNHVRRPNNLKDQVNLQCLNVVTKDRFHHPKFILKGRYQYMSGRISRLLHNLLLL